jgi:hypothetical protein|tara:strand:+ start:2611 stop:3036 length:426 start_codon:yes stop_codon:yes gene_type:complete
MNKIEMALKRPFPESKIRWRKGGGGAELAYITARDVMDRFDATVGFANWQTSYRWIGDRMICKLSVRIDGEWITKSDGADDSNIEGAKGGISDALKRAAVLFGIGRYLYHPNAFDRNKKPAVWATPEGFDKLMEKINETKK